MKAAWHFIPGAALLLSSLAAQARHRTGAARRHHGQCSAMPEHPRPTAILIPSGRVGMIALFFWRPAAVSSRRCCCCTACPATDRISTSRSDPARRLESADDALSRPSGSPRFSIAGAVEDARAAMALLAGPRSREVSHRYAPHPGRRPWHGRLRGGALAAERQDVARRGADRYVELAPTARTSAPIPRGIPRPSQNRRRITRRPGRHRRGASAEEVKGRCR